jgi:hypothetical protein
LTARVPCLYIVGMIDLAPLRLDGPTMVLAAEAYHMRRCLDALGERRVQRIMGLERDQVQAVALGTRALTSRLRDVLDRLFVAVMMLDGVEPWDIGDE